MHKLIMAGSQDQARNEQVVLQSEGNNSSFSMGRCTWFWTLKDQNIKLEGVSLPIEKLLQFIWWDPHNSLVALLYE